MAKERTSSLRDQREKSRAGKVVPSRPLGLSERRIHLILLAYRFSHIITLPAYSNINVMRRKARITCTVSYKTWSCWRAGIIVLTYSPLQLINNWLNWFNCSFGFLIAFKHRVPLCWRISHSPHLLALLKHLSQRTDRQNEADFGPSDGKHSAHQHHRSLKGRIGWQMT